MANSTTVPEAPRAVPAQPRLEDDFRRVVNSLRGALIELFASVGADPGTPQVVSRTFGLNKNLTWKISRIVGASDPVAAIRHIPGATGLDILLTSFASHGAPAPLIAAVRAAARAFADVVELHAGDRAHLDLVLDSMGLLDGAPQLETARELAFKGNSGLWGVQARARITVGFVAPDPADPARLVTALVGGLVEFRRLRPEVAWPLFRFTGYQRDDAPGTGPAIRFTPLDGRDRRPDDPPLLLRDFCSPHVPHIQSRPNALGGVDVVLPEGPVGRTAAFDCFFGQLAGPAPRFRDEANQHGEFSSTISLPVETLLFDLVVHKDVELPMPRVIVFGRRTLAPDVPGARPVEDILPVPDQCVELVGRPPVVSTPISPKHADIVRRVCQQLDRPLSEFRGIRLQMAYPPMGSTVVLRWPLPER